MKIVNMTATGDDNIISEDEKTDLEYRKAQLKKLQDEVVDIEEMSTGISIMDLGLNEFRLDLLEYIKSHPDIDKAPFGMHAVTAANDDMPAGVIYVLKNRANSVNIDNQNRLHPFYMVYISNEGEVICNHLSPKEMLDKMRFLCKGKTEPIAELYKRFNKETRDGSKMGTYSKLLGDAISSIIETKDESDLDAFLSGGNVSFLSNEIKGLDDFELICFLVIKDSDEIVKTKDEFRVVVAGSRNFNDYERLSVELDKLLADKTNVSIISGTANGADKMGEQYAHEHGLKVEQFPAEWDKYSKSAGPIRNMQMVQTADAVIAFWDNQSPGTRHIIDYARKSDVPCKVIRI